jgi:hypothetical protein
MSIPALIRGSATMASIALAPPTECPAMPIRSGSISDAHRECVSEPSTNETSAARPR